MSTRDYQHLPYSAAFPIPMRGNELQDNFVLAGQRAVVPDPHEG